MSSSLPILKKQALRAPSQKPGRKLTHQLSAIGTLLLGVFVSSGCDGDIPRCDSKTSVILVQTAQCVPKCEEGFERIGLDCVAKCGGNATRAATGDCELDCAYGQTKEDGKCVGLTPIAVNSFAYAPDAPKFASYWGDSPNYQLVDADSEEVVFEGTNGRFVKNEDTKEPLYVADFSEFKEKGSYLLRVKGTGDSSQFEIRDDAFDEILRLSMLGFYGWRCGTVVHYEYAGESFAHEACHLDDGYLSFEESNLEKKPSPGGWHDAGDYGKYTSNGAFAVGMLLRAFEYFSEHAEKLSWAIPESGSVIPDFLIEAKWELDWLLSTQWEDGSTSHKVTAAKFSGLDTKAEDDLSRRAHTPIGTEATADFAAAMAQAARVFRPYDAAQADIYLAAAEKAGEFLLKNPAYIRPDLTGFRTGAYQGGGDADDRVWAYAELWDATGKAEYLKAAEALIPQTKPTLYFDWADVGNMGLFAYLYSEREGRNQTVLDAISESVITAATGIVGGIKSHGYGRALNNTYYWGTNGVTLRASMMLEAAARLNPDDADAYREAGVQQLDFVLGRNVHRRSYITGIGHLPPLHPHHRPSIADDVDVPWAGYLIGGSWLTDEAKAEGIPAAAFWPDIQDDYNTGEIAINWNAALAFAALQAHYARSNPAPLKDRVITQTDAGADAGL